MTSPDSSAPPSASARPPRLPGYALPLLLLEAHRSVLDELHAGLARAGHPDVRPAFGYALQAVGPEGATAVEVGRRLGVTKQAAAKTVEALLDRGYLTSEADPADARRKVLHVSERGRDLLRLSAVGFEQIRARWAGQVGAEQVETLETVLLAMTGAARESSDAGLRLDLAGWLGL